MARFIVEHYAGQSPLLMKSLSAFGIGPYTASALLSFAFGRNTAVVDTNTMRVAGRYLYGSEWRGDARKLKKVRESVEWLVGGRGAAQMNYATLDLAALICSARTPKCAVCPVAARCVNSLGADSLGGYDEKLESAS